MQRTLKRATKLRPLYTRNVKGIAELLCESFNGQDEIKQIIVLDEELWNNGHDRRPPLRGWQHEDLHASAPWLWLMVAVVVAISISRIFHSLNRSPSRMPMVMVVVVVWLKFMSLFTQISSASASLAWILKSCWDEQGVDGRQQQRGKKEST